MTMRIACGQKFNLVERGVVTVTSEHAQLTKDRLYDGRPSRAYRTAAAQTDAKLTVDARMTLNPSLETWSGGVPANWSKSGTVVETTVGAEVHSGTSAAKVSGDSHLQPAIPIAVKSGQAWKVDVWARITAASSASAAVQIFNPNTGKYLTSGGAWSATPQACTSTTSSSYVNLTKTFTVESFAVCGYRDQTTLYVRLRNEGAGDFAFFDDATLYPGVNFTSLHGHNIDPLLAIQLRSDTDGTFGAGETLEATLTNAVPSMYTLLGSTIYKPWWRVQLTGVGITPLEVGEWVVCEVRQPLRNYSAPVESGSRWDRQASVTPGVERHVHKRSKWQVRNKVFHYKYLNRAQYDEGLELFHLRPDGDTYPVVIVPDTALSEVIHGKLESTLADARILEDVYFDVTVVLSESPFASSAF